MKNMKPYCWFGLQYLFFNS